MKKVSLKKKITELKKYLKTPVAQDALEQLLSELDFYQEPEAEALELVPPKELNSADTLGIFSDGGCRGNPGPGAYAYIIQNSAGEILSENGATDPATTNNKMELRGVIEGLKDLQSHFKAKNIFVYTDSKYVVDGVNSWMPGWKKRGWKKADKKAPENLELWQELDQLVERLSPKFIWVKGHAGHPQNELVDQMANTLMDESGY